MTRYAIHLLKALDTFGNCQKTSLLTWTPFPLDPALIPQFEKRAITPRNLKGDQSAIERKWEGEGDQDQTPQFDPPQE